MVHNSFLNSLSVGEGLTDHESYVVTDEDLGMSFPKFTPEENGSINKWTAFFKDVQGSRTQHGWTVTSRNLSGNNCWVVVLLLVVAIS